MQKVRYELDPHNKLVIYRSGKKSRLSKFRKVLDGRFKTDKNNELTYHVKEPLSEDESVPRQIRLKGDWSLTEDHRLRLTLEKSGRTTYGDQITFQGDILDVNKNSLLFAVTTTTKDGLSTYVLELGGSWKADERNRLTFHVKKESGRYDILTFSGAWEINKDHQIIYQYEKARLIRKRKETHTLTFKGHWDIRDALRLSYTLSKGNDSVFDLNASAGVFKDNFIKYELGIGSAGRARPVRRTVTLYGKWNLKRDVGLTFEIEYESGRIGAIVFGADARLMDRNTVSFRLRSGVGNKDLGADLELSRKLILGDGEAFLRLLATRQEASIYAGMAWRW